jgi:hypothetical protein
MVEERTSRRRWSKPELRRLGTIKDVSGAQGAGAQSAGVKT